MALTPGGAGYGYAQGMFYGGDATVGAVPISNVQVAVEGVEVTSTAAVQVAGYVVSTNYDQLIRLEGSVNVGNTGSILATLAVAYTDANTGNAETVYFYNQTGAKLDGLALAAGVSGFQPLLLPCQKGTTVVVTYTDADGTPSDYVTSVVSVVA